MEKVIVKIFLLYFFIFLFPFLLFCYKMGLGNFDIQSKSLFYAIYTVKNRKKNRQLEGRQRAF